MSWYDPIIFYLGFVFCWLLCIWLDRTPNEDEIRHEEEVWVKRMEAHDREFEALWHHFRENKRKSKEGDG